ncbi:Gustatory receptor 60 [Frankliniella occidentalis]|nr:Gustatory receptor 60 [Frankliniella occidentalis]
MARSRRRSLVLTRRVLVAHWHCNMVVLQLNGFLGCSGWPPRWSRAWTYYALLSLVLFAIARAAQILSFIQLGVGAKNATRQDDISFMFRLFTYDICARCIAFVLMQAVLVHRSRELSLLVRAVLLYLRSYSCPKRKHVSRQAVLLCHGVHFIFNTIYLIDHSNVFFTTTRYVRFIVYGMLPTILVGMILDSFVHIVSANVDFVAAIADDVQEHIDTLRRLRPRVQAVTGRVTAVNETHHALDELGGEQGSEQSDERVLARGLRALRVRYQCVQDVVHATNWLYGGFNVIAITTSLIRGVVFVYCGLLITVVFAGDLGGRGDNIRINGPDGAWFLCSGTLLIGKLIFMCAIGQQMSSESSRISDTLQTGITRYPDMDPLIEREIQWFIRQIRIQDIRFGVFDLFYFDLKSMNRIIASSVTYIVVLVQFSAISAHGRCQLKVSRNTDK